MRSYQRKVHTPRRLLGVLALLALVSLVVAAVTRGRVHQPRRRETFLLAGSGLAMLLGTAATSEFVLRYLIPAVPLLVCGGAVAAADLAAAIRPALRALSPARLRRAFASPAPVTRIQAAPARALPHLSEGPTPATRLARRRSQVPR